MEENELAWLANFQQGTRIKWFDRDMKAWYSGVITGGFPLEGHAPVITFRLDQDNEHVAQRVIAYTNRDRLTKEVKYDEIPPPGSAPES